MVKIAKTLRDTLATRGIEKKHFQDYAYDLWYSYMRKWEGGYSNDPDDPGGETMRGVTLRTFRRLGPKLGYAGNDYELFRRMPEELHRKIAREAFWNPVAKYLENECITIYVVDYIWGSGSVGVKKIQRYLNERYGAGLEVDGIFGAKTAEALNKAIKKRGAKSVLKDLMNIREHHLLVQLQPKYSKFYKGWRNRLMDARRVVRECMRIKKNENSLLEV